MAKTAAKRKSPQPNTNRLPVEGLAPIMVTAEQLAGVIMVSKNYIVDLKERGVIRTSGRKPKGSAPKPAALYDLVDSVQGMILHIRGMKQIAEPDTAMKNAKTREVQIRTAERERTLIPLEEAVVLGDSVVSTLRTLLAGLPNRLTRDLALRKTIEKGIDEVLTQAADEYQAKADKLNSGDSLVDAEIEADDVQQDDDELEDA